MPTSAASTARAMERLRMVHTRAGRSVVAGGGVSVGVVMICHLQAHGVRGVPAWSSVRPTELSSVGVNRLNVSGRASGCLVERGSSSSHAIATRTVAAAPSLGRLASPHIASLQFPPQFRGSGATDPMDTPDGTILGDTYMPDAVDGMGSILI